MTWTRRHFLGRAAAAPFGPGLAAQAATNPAAGAVQAGDVTPRSAVLWAQGVRAGTWRFRVRAEGGRPVEARARATVASGLTAQVQVAGLSPGRTYGVQADLLDEAGRGVARARGRFRTAGGRSAPVRFAWSGDVVGQGFGIDRARGGLFAFDTLADEAPDFFIFSGDTIYADNPLQRSVELRDGTMWNNLVTSAKASVAESLDDFRGQFLYNWLDPAYRRFLQSTPVIAQWDDHEVRNNWFPGRSLAEDPRYSVKDCSVLAARARRAFSEAFPRSPGAEDRIFRRVSRGPLLDVFVIDARTYRTSNVASGPGPHRLFGEAQAEWLARGLTESKALWKVVACDLPVGLTVGDGPGRFEAVSNGEPGPPGFREVEFDRLLRSVGSAGRRNVVFVTADVHYAAAHRYRRPFPFWEFVAGPLHAGQFGPNDLDDTFGPEVVFSNRSEGDPINVPPSKTSASYGMVEIEPKSGVMTVSLRNGGGHRLFEQRLEPAVHG